jgi:sodium-dependent dicarboxylate transporter 2/3/5
LSSSGIAIEVGEALVSLSGQNLQLLGLLVVFLAVLMSEFSSNTASASIIIPILIGALAKLAPESVLSIVIAAAYGASFGFMLPVSTPPNAIIYGSGKIPIQQMIRTGASFDVLGGLIIFLLVVILYPLLGLL